jgi:hypothetical protein
MILHMEISLKMNNATQQALKNKVMKPKLIKGLHQADEQLSALSKKRQQEADKYYQMGFKLLDVAYQQNCQNLESLEQVCVYFTQAMRHNRSDVRPYLALSYLFSLVNNYVMAWKYAKAVKELYPENQIVLEWEANLKSQEEKFKNKQAQPAQLSNDQQIDDLNPAQIKLIENKLRAFIISQAQEITSQKPPQPTLRPEELEQLNNSLQNYQKVADQVSEQLDILNKYIDTQSLEYLYQPLLVNLKRYRETIGASMTFYELNDRSTELLNQVQELEAQIKGLTTPDEISPLQDNLEEILDQCDLIADHIDQIEEQGFQLSPILALYKKLTRHIESCQTLLDTTIERFNKNRRQRREQMPPEPSTAGIKALLQSMSAQQLTFFADRLWFLLPLNPHQKSVAGLQAFCLQPETPKLGMIAKELLNTIGLNTSPENSAEAYASLALVFQSYSKPLLADEYLAYAQSLAPDLSATQNIMKWLTAFNSNKKLWVKPKKAPVPQAVLSLIQNSDFPISRVASHIQVLLPNNLTSKAADLYSESLELLCNFCMRTDRNSLLSAADRLLTALAKQERSDDVYALMGAIFFACGKPLLAQEYIGYAKALEPELLSVNYVLERAAHLKMPEPPKQQSSTPSVAASVSKPSAEIAMNTLRNPAPGLDKIAQNLSQLLEPLKEAFPKGHAARQGIQAFYQNPNTARWGEAIHVLNQTLESNQVQAEDYALMGLLLYASGKPLLFFEHLNYAASLNKSSALILTLVARFQKPK